ncbi:MAG: putative bifunctional diguanylate cyclase/phosphodiesterase [Gammaproteobacteria bacterium]
MNPETSTRTPTTRGLRRQATIRLALMMLATTLLVGVLAHLAYRSLHANEIANARANLEGFYQLHLQHVARRWDSDAEQTRARIEFTRILEEDDVIRWPKLNAYLNAQWEYTQFPNLFITTRDGQTVFRFGTIARSLEDAGALSDRTWFFDPGTRELHRVYRLPLWLGKDGQGQLVLMKAVTPSVLAGISAPDTTLDLLHDGQIIARTHPPVANGVGAAQTTAQDNAVSADLPWSTGGNPVVVLRATQGLRGMLPWRDFLLPPLLGGLLLLVFVWFGLGRWLGGTLKRIAALKEASRAFASGTHAADARRYLGPAARERDEVHDVAAAMGEMMEAVEQRHQEQRVYLDTLSVLEEAVLELDTECRIQRASPGWVKLARDTDSIGAPLVRYFHEEDADTLHLQCMAIKRGEKEQATLRLRLRSANPEESRWTECRLIRQRDADGITTGLRGVLRDITQTYLHERQISHMAMHDALTQLPNRMLVEDRLKVALRMASRTGRLVGVCFIDLDHFKNVNDALGHKAGDKLLVAFSERLRAQLRAGDTLARWGGDEFVLLLPDIAEETDVRGVVHKISEAMQAPFPLEDTAYVMTFSMGVALYPVDAKNIDDLLSEADRAMFYAKAQGRNQVAFFGDILHKADGRKDLYIQNHLAVAIQERAIQAWYQPLVEAESGRCVAVEVLARWNDSTMGWVPPDTFIPIAENLGLIHQLGSQVWQAAIEAVAGWRHRGYDLMLSVNISKRQLFNDTFTSLLLDDLARHNLPPQCVILEVTESLALMDVENAVERLPELKRAGFRLAIDDFGTGYSSLSQLHEMPVDELKIDISFVRRLTDPRGLSMVQTIISLASTLGLKTIAEGVEDAGTADKLRMLGVNTLQGFHFAKPMPRDEFELWLARFCH